MNLSEFDPLYRRFQRALEWINDEYRRRGYDTRRILLDANFQKDIKEFNDRVVVPMDQAWTQLTPSEKESFCGEPGEKG